MARQDTVRDVPGLAPKVSTFNRISDNLDYLNTLLSFRGALIAKSVNQSVLIAANNTNVTITFASAVYDTSSIWGAGNPDRLTVPSGVTRIKLKAAMSLTVTQPTTRANLIIYKNTTEVDIGPGVPPGPVFAVAEGYGDESGSQTIQAMTLESPPFECVAGDYFNLIVLFSGMNGTITIAATSSWFSMEIIE